MAKKTAARGKRSAKSQSRTKATELPRRIAYGEEGFDEAIRDYQQEVDRWERAEHYFYCKLFAWYREAASATAPLNVVPWRDDDVRKLRPRAMKEWQNLTGLPPLSSVEPERWYSAALAARKELGMPVVDLQSMHPDWLAEEIILPWALAKRAVESGAVYLGDGLLQVDGKPFRIEEQERAVLEALIKLRAANKQQLITESGYQGAVTVLKRIVAKHAQLEPYISIPGGRGKGGYSTTVQPTDS